MKTPSEPRLVAGFRRFAQVAAAGAVLISTLVLVGWALGVETLQAGLAGRTAMNPGGTAVAVLLAGVSLWLQADPARRRRGPALAFASGVVLIAGLRLVGYLTGWDGGPDPLLFRDQLDREALRTGHPNRMAPNTAGALLLVGLALLLLDARAGRYVISAQFLALGAGFVALLAVLGYAYSALALAGVEQFIPMAMNTGLALALLGGGVLCARPDRGPIAVVTRPGPGGVMARRLLPAAVLIPIAVGLVRGLGQKRG
jgi:hypothetical protein